MSRYRVEFVKEDQVRFISHLDLVKAFERAIRRAGIPVAFSEGFNPHPKMSFASALAVGVTSAAEYLDLELQRDTAPAELAEKLAGALPPGLKPTRVRQTPERSPQLMAVVNRAVYQIHVPHLQPIRPADLDGQVEHFLGSAEIMITKRTKKGPRPKNIRPGIIALAAVSGVGETEFTLTSAISNDGNVRPEEVILALRERSGLPLDLDGIRIKRLALLIADREAAVNPLDFGAE